MILAPPRAVSAKLASAALTRPLLRLARKALSPRSARVRRADPLHDAAIGPTGQRRYLGLL